MKPNRSVRILGVALALLSLGGTAHAQSSDAPSQPTATTQPGQDPPPPPPPPPTPSSTTTTTTQPPLKALAVSVSPRVGRVGTTVTLTGDLRGCAQLTAASGVFVDRAGRSRPLADQLVTRDLRFLARYTVTTRDAIGWGRFKVACHQDATTVGLGTVGFQVRPQVSPPLGPVRVAVSPPAGRPGTTVTITADVGGGCDPASAFFQDRKGWGVTAAAKRAPIVQLNGRQLVARYTITNHDAVGRGRFGVACDRGDTGRVGYASFQVLAPRPGPGPGPGPGGGNGNYQDGSAQLPTQIDTGLGGTADRGIDPVWLLLPAGLLLIAVAVALRLRQATSRRRL
jgi:hypothetical protein